MTKKYEYRAVLIELYQEEIGDQRSIYIAPNSSQLLAEIEDVIMDSVKMLFDSHAENINLLDLDILHESYGEGDYPNDGWDFLDVERLISSLIKKRKNELSTSSENESILGQWYEIIEWINDDLPGYDCVMIPVEDNILGFINRLFDMELSNFNISIDEFVKNRNGYSISDLKKRYNKNAEWIGWLSTIKSEVRWDESKERESYKLLFSLVDDFNNTYQFR